MKRRTETTTWMILTLALLALTGCSSDDPITTPQTVLPDTAPPAIPTGLSAAASISAVELVWDPNTSDNDFLGFRIYRLAFDAVLPLSEVPNPEPRFLDTNPLVHTACYYAVTSVDELGNESAWQTLFHDPTVERQILHDSAVR